MNIIYKKTNYPNGNHCEIHKRSMVEAVLYIVKTGCQWRSLPSDFPKWNAVKSFYYREIKKGIWEKVMLSLVEKI